MQTVSESYLQGIKDGRAHRRLCGTQKEIEAAAETDLRFCASVSECAYSATQREYVKGLRDFWANQLTKAS